MLRRRSTGSIFISNLDPKIKERILNLKISNEELKKFDKEEKKESVQNLNDLRDLPNHTENEIYSTLNALYQNSQFFIYCGPLLLNINPGPGRTYDYLNLQKWLSETAGLPDTQWKPHLYSFINYVYQTLCNENQDQVINMLGQIGSGKTFNLIHIIEYLTVLAGPDNLQMEVFDIIHKSIQLIHIMGSIFRQNNMESTCCALLLKLSFNEDHKICGFDIESKIMDFTLPFSENGRSFSILHALMCANKEIKQLLELPESEKDLNFFKKFLKNFDAKTKEKFKLNDMEIWTRFHSLLNSFGFSKNETLDILQLLSFILLINESSIGKRKCDKYDEYFITKSVSSKKVAKTLGITEDEFLTKIGVYRDLNDIKSALITLMKYGYFIVFDYILNKVKRYSKKYFTLLNQETQQGNTNTLTKKGETTTKKDEATIPAHKNLYFIDIPGEIDDQTLGGMTTNLANECLNLFASHQFLSMVEKLEKEKLNIKFIQPLHCVDVVDSLIGENSLTRFLSKKFNEKNFYKFKTKCETVDYLKKTVDFSEPDSVVQGGSRPDQYVFKFNFSHKTVLYNVDSLHLEVKSLTFSKRLLSILELSKNGIIKHTLKTELRSKLLEPKTFYNFIHSCITDIFAPLQGLAPFVVYCFHSNSSLKLFFGDKFEPEKDGYSIPLKLTTELCRHSLLLPILYWEWFGYHEWISVEAFGKEFAGDFEILKDRILKTKSARSKIKDINFKDLNPFEVATFILSILIGEKQYIIGAHHVILRRGVLKEIRKILDNLHDIHKINRKASLGKQGSNKGSNYSIAKKTSGNLQQKTTEKNLITNHSNKPTQALNNNESKAVYRSQSIGVQGSSSNVNVNLKPITRGSVVITAQRKKSLKVHCHYDIIEETKKQEELNKDKNEVKPTQPTKYNLYTMLTLKSSPDQFTEQAGSEKKKIIQEETKNEKENANFEEYIKKNNIIVATNMNTFNVFKKVLVSQDDNFELFDYSEHTAHVCRIQAGFKAYQARRKYKVYRYVVRKLVMLQRNVRGWVIRMKFARYKKVTNCVSKIQTIYRDHFTRRVRAITLIQSRMRAYLRAKRGDNMMLPDEEDQPKRGMNMKLQEELLQASAKDAERKRTHMTKKSGQSQRATTNNQLKSASDHLNNLDINKEEDRSKMIEQLMEMSIVTKHTKDMNESNLGSQHNHSGFDMGDKFNNFFKKPKKRAPGDKKIEDKLIEYGESMKKKRAEQKIQKLKDEETTLIFKPQTNQQTGDFSKVGGSNFLDRMNYLNTRKENKIKDLRSKKVDANETECSFQPKLTDMAKKMPKRTVDNLYDWKHKKDEVLNKKIKEKMIKEDKDLEELTKKSVVNKHSEYLLSQKTKEKNTTQNNVEFDEDVDLWPVQMTKAYFEKNK